MKDKTEYYSEKFNLSKVPDSVLLSQARTKIGVLEATIDELTYELEQMTKERDKLQGILEFPELAKEASKEVRKEARYKEMQEQIKTLTELRKRDRRDRDTMLCTISELRRKLESFQIRASESEDLNFD